LSRVFYHILKKFAKNSEGNFKKHSKLQKKLTKAFLVFYIKISEVKTHIPTPLIFASIIIHRAAVASAISLRGSAPTADFNKY
jgi:23S rRNA maturation-related 3'-5' exoribonuclease YhaM